MRNVFAAAVALLALATPLAALAEEFQRVEGQVRESIPAGPYLAGAYGFIFAAIVAYVVLLVRRQRRIETELDELRRKIERGA